MSTPWQIDITAPTRAAAIEQIQRAHLPLFAERHLVGVLKGEAGNYLHPADDRPVRVWGNGADHGSYIDIETACIAYES